MLDRLIENERQFGNWVYKSHDQYKSIAAVCNSIKGDIRRKLCFWTDAARLLVTSTEMFKFQEKPNRKGSSESLALLAETLYNMPEEDFLKFAQQLQLGTNHPFHEAIKCVTEAASYLVYTPWFYLKCKAGISHI